MAKSSVRDTYKYAFKIGNKIVYFGVTNDLERREAEHQTRWPDGHVVQVGYRTTRQAALVWERETISRHQRTGARESPFGEAFRPLSWMRAVWTRYDTPCVTLARRLSEMGESGSV